MAEQSDSPASATGERSAYPDQGPTRQESARAVNDAPVPGAGGSPFAEEAEVLRSRMVTEDDISASQSAPNAAALVNAEHIAGLIYPVSYAEMSPTESRSPDVQRAVQQGGVVAHTVNGKPETLTDRGVNPPDPALHQNAEMAKDTGEHQ